MMTEQELVEKLVKIERLFAGATTGGERDAAAQALQRIQDRLFTLSGEEEPLEFQFSMTDPWSRKLFLALLRRYHIKPYRYSRQRRSTVMAKIPRAFLNETLWPEYQELNKVLSAYVSEITDRIIREHIHNDASEADVSDAPPKHIE
ncbi:MAG: hypothetical protein ACI9QL_005454 [Candidatus Omnitrophota bacterium]|jgi:hypothetical protein